MSSFLYHYTSIQGMQGIIRKKEDHLTFWFTDYRFLNDISEGKELKRIFEICCDNLLKDRKISREDYELIKDFTFSDKSLFF